MQLLTATCLHFRTGSLIPIGQINASTCTYPNPRGQEEGTRFDLEGKIWHLAKSHGDSAPLDRYTEPTLRERAGRAWHPLPFAGTHRHPHTLGKWQRQSHRQSTNKRQHMEGAVLDCCQQHGDERRPREKAASCVRFHSVKITSLTLFFKSHSTFTRNNAARLMTMSILH